MYVPGNLIRPIATIVCSANYDARLLISAIQIRIKQYKLTSVFFGFPCRHFYLRSSLARLLHSVVAFKFLKHSKSYVNQHRIPKVMMNGVNKNSAMSANILLCHLRFASASVQNSSSVQLDGIPIWARDTFENLDSKSFSLRAHVDEGLILYSKHCNAASIG